MPVDFRSSNLIAQCAEFFVRIHLEPEMVQACLCAPLRNGEVDAGIFQHPLCVVGLAHRRLGPEYRRIKADVCVEVINSDMHVKAFHDLLLSGLRLVCSGAQQPSSAVSITAKHSCGMPLQQFRVRNVISAAICAKSAM